MCDFLIELHLEKQNGPRREKTWSVMHEKKLQISLQIISV